MTERSFPFTSEKVFRIEHERELGHNTLAAVAVTPVLDFPLGSFGGLSEEDKKLLMMATRIGTVSELGLANRAWKASTVAQHLAEARKFIEVSRHPAVSQAAAEIHTDTENTAYEFHTEMRRDEVSYSLSVAALVGNPGALDLALDQLWQLVEESREPVSRTLSDFYRARIMHRRDPSRNNFLYLQRAFRDAVQASRQINSWDRVATVSARYTVDACRSGHPLEAVRGGLVNSQSVLADPVTVKSLPKEIYKSTTESLRHRIWRATRSADYSYLQLS